MIIDMDKMITTLSAIFVIVILSSSSVQSLMNDKLRKKLINSLYLKHLVLILSIYTSKTYEVIKIGNDNNNDMKKNLFKSVLVWLLFQCSKLYSLFNGALCSVIHNLTAFNKHSTINNLIFKIHCLALLIKSMQQERADVL